MLVYITGLSGVGKTTLEHELALRGYKSFGDDLIAGYRHRETAEFQRHKPNDEWREHDWWYDEEKVLKLKESNKDDVVFICGISKNVAKIAELADVTIVLTTHGEVIKERLTNRTNNPYGKDQETQDRVVADLSDFERWAREAGFDLVDAQQPLKNVADDIEEIVKKSS